MSERSKSTFIYYRLLRLSYANPNKQTKKKTLSTVSAYTFVSHQVAQLVLLKKSMLCIDFKFYFLLYLASFL